MSADSVLPLPKFRELRSAQSGGVFFIKWMICASIQAIISTAAGVAVISTNRGLPEPFGPILWIVPMFLPAWALFGFRWRAWAWWVCSVAAFFVWYYYLHWWNWRNIRWIALPMVPQGLLLIGARHRAALWLVAYPLAQSMDVLFNWRMSTGKLLSLVEAFWTWIDKVPFVRVYGAILGWNGTRMFAAVVLGTMLAWLMPPIIRPALRLKTDEEHPPDDIGHAGARP
jgi:hypothetical protein